MGSGDIVVHDVIYNVWLTTSRVLISTPGSKVKLAATSNSVVHGMHRYKRVLRACALQPDIDILPEKDLTEIGDKV